MNAIERMKDLLFLGLCRMQEILDRYRGQAKERTSGSVIEHDKQVCIPTPFKVLLHEGTLRDP